MIVLVQRVNFAKVICESGKVSEIGKGILTYVGFEKGDSREKLEKSARKLINLRIFEDESGKMNLSIKDINGEILLVSNFTLPSDLKKGNRPSFDKAMDPSSARSFYEEMLQTLRKHITVKSGVFGDNMKVISENDGPVNFILTL